MAPTKATKASGVLGEFAGASEGLGGFASSRLCVLAASDGLGEVVAASRVLAVSEGLGKVAGASRVLAAGGVLAGREGFGEVAGVGGVLSCAGFWLPGLGLAVGLAVGVGLDESGHTTGACIGCGAWFVVCLVLIVVSTLAGCRLPFSF